MRQLRMTKGADAQALAMLLAARIAGILAGAVQARGRAGLFVSGGSTPRPFFVMLSRAAIAWDRIVISLVDERWVEPDHPDSNEGQVRRYLLQDQAAAARLIALKNAAPTARQGEDETEDRLRQDFPWPPDAVVLGMGLDGHTARSFLGLNAWPRPRICFRPSVPGPDPGRLLCMNG